jgi:hypothetical protein
MGLRSVDPLPRLRVERIWGWPFHRSKGPTGLSFRYGTPVEPTPHWPAWRRNVWRNRPCCFLHFDVLWTPDRPDAIPPGARPAVVGGKRGLLKPAGSYSMSNGPGNEDIYFGNHWRFTWLEGRVRFVATLHTFGPGTRRLLGRLVGELEPSRKL